MRTRTGLIIAGLTDAGYITATTATAPTAGREIAPTPTVDKH